MPGPEKQTSGQEQSGCLYSSNKGSCLGRRTKDRKISKGQ